MWTASVIVCVTTLVSSLETAAAFFSCQLSPPVQLVLYRAARQSSGRPRSPGVQSRHTLGNSSPAVHTKYMLDLLLQSGKAVSSNARKGVAIVPVLVN